ncbi:hypothetical protein HanRHA438_Chr04g0152361 [Helianthus annuus]|nr:hypothetical protein HanRHA438_Chr04g0152361 [Helianthus annuus]
MNEHEQRLRSFIYVHERWVTCSFMFSINSSLGFFYFYTLFIYTTKFTLIKYLINTSVSYI